MVRILAINLLLCLLIIEGVAFLATGFIQPIEVAGTQLAPGQQGKPPRFRLAPYFGYLQRPNTSLLDLVPPSQLVSKSPDLSFWKGIRTNNHGFLSQLNYPYYPASDDEFVIAIVGGSVAQWFAVQAGKSLVDQLSRGSPKRKFQLLNLAQPGYKQPQQLLVIAYYLSVGQKINMVINIDGFNELALGLQNSELGIDQSMPMAKPLEQLLAGAGLVSDVELLEDFYENRYFLLHGNRWATRHAFCVTNTCKIATSILANRAYSKFSKSHAGVIRDEDAMSLFPDFSIGSSRHTTAIHNWKQGTLLLQRLVEGAGAEYLHLVQPNQYWTTRKFSEEERRIAFSETSPYRSAIETGYGALIGEAHRLSQEGFPVHDMSQLFDDEPRPVFSDTCCHLNQFGNELLADRAASLVLEKI